MERIHLVVIGAGWHGLTMAKTYHEAYPDATMRIFDSARSIGGVWAEERLYPGLKTNNIVGSYEFSDFPLEPGKYNVRNGQHIPGLAVHRYLSDAAERFGISQFLQLATKVESASRNEDRSWTINYYTIDPGGSTYNRRQSVAEKLVIATGLTSEPFMPYLKGKEQFHGLILHSRQLKDRADELGAAQNVVVIGGNKSAWDVCYSVAQSGRQAHMVLRPSGGGPLGSLIGRWITLRFWSILGWVLRRQNGYDESCNTKKLMPWYSLFWMGNSLGVHNYDTPWFDLARKGKINVHIGNVEYLQENSVKLSNAEIRDVDALVCCTGWKAEPPIKFTPAEVLNNMGIPGSVPLSDELSGKARHEIIRQRPILEAGPMRRSVEELETPDNATKSGQLGPYRLYRYVVPADSEFMADRNIAFLGMDLSVHAIMVAQAQALWITAFFEGEISRLRSETIDQRQVEMDTALHVEYQKLRRPRGAGGHGAGFPDLVFDSVPYVDLLLQDLGLKTWRKNNAFADLFKPYSLSDYQGLVQEWKALDLHL